MLQFMVQSNVEWFSFVIFQARLFGILNSHGEEKELHYSLK